MNIFTKSLAKTISYRACGSLVTMAMSYQMTKNVKLSLSIGVSDFLVKPIIYFIHELIWEKWGK